MAYKERFRPFEILTGCPSDAETPEWNLHRP
jgi:hypothetical protein